jgi:hypothetical protein
MDNYCYCNNGGNGQMQQMPLYPPQRNYFDPMFMNNANTEILLFVIIFLLMFTTYGNRYYY